MTIFLIALIIVVLILLVVLIFLVRRIKGVQSQDIEVAVSRTWTKLGLAQTIGAVETHAREIKDSYRDFEKMLTAPKESGDFGELSLEKMLSDQLPPDMYGIRKKILDGKEPDANIKSTVGLICIDSKFPRKNYMMMLEAEKAEQPEQRESAKKDFIKDTRSHLNKICADYVCPEKGSAEFAFAYIPSEAVYYFLVTEAFDMLRDYARKGVQVVSPLTFSQKVELIKAGVQAKKLSEDAEQVRQQLGVISNGFIAIDKEWRTFYQTHFTNAVNKAGDVDKAYKKLRDEFDRMSKLPEG